MSEEITNLEILPPVNQPEPFAVVPLKKATTLPNLWWKWQQTREPMRPSTREKYYRAGRLFTEFFRDRRFSPQEFLNWFEFVKMIPSPAAHGLIGPGGVNRINTFVRSFLKWLHQMRFLEHDLSACIPTMPVPGVKQPMMITEEQYQAIKKWCVGRLWTQPLLWLVVLSYRTGMSLVDCCHLRWKDVHLFDNGPSYISIIRRKMETRSGERARCQIPIIAGSDVHQWILSLRKVVNYKRFDGINDYVHQDCPGIYEWKGAFDSLNKQMRRIFKGAGIPKGTTFRHLRNSLCSALVNSGMNLALVCKITGHTDPKTLLIYLNPDRTALQDGMAKAYRYSMAQLSKLEPPNGITLYETKDTDGTGTTEEDDGGDSSTGS